MSDQDPGVNGGPGSVRAGAVPASPWATARQRRGSASVTLRREPDQDDYGSLMDPATQSLSDALRITFRLVQAAVLVLVAVYLLSGFRTVVEGQKAIRLVFGRPVSDDLGPGFQFSLPEPMGELIKVPTGQVPVEIDTDFFPKLTDQERKSLGTPQGVASLAGGGTGNLNPEEDGSLITADGSIAHAQVRVKYHRADPRKVVASMDPDMEGRIVRGAVEQGVVRAAASLSIDEFLKNSPDPTRRSAGAFRTADRVARDVAQEALDRVDAGITIDELSMTAKIPPRRVMTAFNEVQSSQAKANQERENAEADRRTTLTNTAGDAAEVLLAQIDRYEKQTELKQEQDGAATLAVIDDLLMGVEVTIDGKKVHPAVVGQVAAVLAGAREYQSSQATRAATEAVRFSAKRESFKTNPLVLVSSEWSEAYKAFATRPMVQTMLLPPGLARLVVQLNRDPDIARQQTIAKQTEEGERARQERQKMRERDQFEKKVEPVERVTGG